MNPIFNSILAFIKKEGWACKEFPETTSAFVNLKAQNGAWVGLLQSREKEEQVIFYSVCPFPVPFESRYPIAEFITIVNNEILMGNFMMDFNDGELKYKTMAILEKDKTPSVELLKKLVYGNILVMDQFLPAIVDIINLDVSPIQAFQKVTTVREENAS